MESLGTGRNGAQRGRKGQEEAGRGRKGQKEASPLPAPVPSDSIAGPPKKGKKSLAYPPLGSFYLFTFYPFTFKCMNFLPLSVHTR